MYHRCITVCSAINAESFSSLELHLSDEFRRMSLSSKLGGGLFGNPLIVFVSLQRFKLVSEDPESAGGSLRELLEFGKGRVPKDLWAETEIRLMARTGLQLLDLGVQNRILNSCRKVLRGSGV
ncbi:hypothetical protein DVH24_000015 [Malus domestica]|uniref:Uncharacterized protein n=1 Tax=Malus domestica TaxID=3750 RepID=A0A498IZB2_MALDO|nr:hypothetical protein DVH24_000015 [Malus domestica]